MRHTSVLIAVLGVLAIPALASADLRETTAFRVDVPPTWEVQIKEAPSADGKVGSWAFVSPTRDKRMFVHIGRRRAGTLAQVWDAFIGERLAQTLRHIKVEGFHEKVHGPVEVGIGFLYAAGRRIKTGQLYKYAVLAIRDSRKDRMAYVALGGTEKHWGEALARLDTILQTLELK